MRKKNIYNRILSILCSVLDAYSAVLFLPLPGEDPEKEDCAYYIASVFSLGDKVDRNMIVRKGQGLVGWILRNQEPLLVSNYDQRRNHLGYYDKIEENTIKAFMGCFLPKGAGAICLDSKRQYSFSEKDQKLLYLFAELLSDMQREISERESRNVIFSYYAALRLIYELRKRHSRWSAFLKHFLDLLSDTTGFSYGLFCSRDSHGENYTVEGETRPILHAPGAQPPAFTMHHGVVGWVFKNSAPVFNQCASGSPEASLVGASSLPNFQTIMACPLVIQRKTRGVLCLAAEQRLEMSEATKDFVKMAADHLALFLENIYVKCRLRDLHRHTVALQENMEMDGQVE